MAHDHDHDHSPASPADPIDHRAVIVTESARFADLLDAGPLDAQVDGCPGWTLRDLGVHLGDVQRWATGVITTGGPDGAEHTPAPDTALADWFREGTAGLLDAIDASDPTEECWNLWPTGEKTMAFWYRRQANEVAVHRWDAEAAVGAPNGFDAALAADIVDEWAHVMLPRRVDRGDLDLAGITGDLHLHCTDTAGEWTLDLVDGALVTSDEHRKSAVAARGPAAALALLVYNRGDRSGVEVFGDGALLDAWLA